MTAPTLIRNEWRQCRHKRRYNKREAKNAIKGTRARGLHLGSYRCPWCDYWHVGHIIRREARSEAS